YSPTSGFEDFKFQPPTYKYGVKWNTDWNWGETSRTFTIVLDDHYPAGTVQATVKYGNNYKTGDILGPICYPRFGNFQGGSLTVTKAVELNGWDADSTTFDICIQGPSYPNGNESGACHAFSGGESYTWQGLQAGDYTVSETNPDAANWTVTGEGAVTVSQGQTATKTITNTRKMNDVTVTKTATTVYTRTNTYEWDIDKTVTPTQTDLFEGESTVLTYTVSVTPSLASQVDSGHRVSGAITVTNPGPAKTRVASVTDVLADATCAGVTFPKELAAGESFTCSYAADLGGAISGTNVATATLTNQSSFTGSKDYAFGEPTTTIDVKPPITVTDTQPSSSAPWTFNDSGSQTYSHQVTCNLNAFDEGNSYNIPVANTATIDQTGQSASANANVTCWVGDLEVIKVVNWGSATPDQGKTFEICVTGPSFPQGDCKSVGYNGGSAVWQNIVPGAYTVVETDPGQGWAVSGSGVQVNVPAGGSAQTTITNSTDAQTGDLQVTKVVDWGNVTPDQGKTFEICITGPSFPQGDCKSVGYNGGSAIWQGLTPGAYTVVETDPGAEWTVSGNNVQVNVPAGGSAQTTITNSTVIPASLGDFVWEDKNQNGIQDEGEPGIPGVLVTLCRPEPEFLPAATDNNIVGTTTTDENGRYSFTDLLPGDYCVQVTPPPNFDFTIPNAGDDPTKNSKVDPSTGMTPVITLNPGDNDPNQDAGLFNTQPTGLEEGDQPASNMLYLPMLGR
ncbi:MAG: SdrD B-like domain-containing protein, partial [Chloroflexota bacterium]|nr:SdrD B-like domain-containing protein [Chloroflexota bacterium]